jgi:hypothetical protein
VNHRTFTHASHELPESESLKGQGRAHGVRTSRTRAALSSHCCAAPGVGVDSPGAGIQTATCSVAPLDVAASLHQRIA